MKACTLATRSPACHYRALVLLCEEASAPFLLFFVSLGHHSVFLQIQVCEDTVLHGTVLCFPPECPHLPMAALCCAEPLRTGHSYRPGAGTEARPGGGQLCGSVWVDREAASWCSDLGKLFVRFRGWIVSWMDCGWACCPGDSRKFQQPLSLFLQWRS